MGCDSPPASRLAGVGLGLRAPHVADIIATRPSIAWLEVHAENYFVDAPALAALERIRRDYPLSIHGVGLSLGGAEPLDHEHLRRLRALVDRLDPALISEHLAWCGIGGVLVNDLLPVPCTEEALEIVSGHVARTQDVLGRPILIENPSSYLRFDHADMTEPQFLTRLAERCGCGVLVDVNNIHVSARNLGFDALEYLNAITPVHVGEIHLAGYSVDMIDGEEILIDTHGAPVHAPVWDLYARAIERFGQRPTLVEWDTDIPSLDVLLAETRRAARIMTKQAEREDGRAA